MDDFMEQRQKTGGPSLELVSVEAFKRQHRPPINIRWAIQKNYHEMVEAGALYRFGRKLLIDPHSFWLWLREKGRRDA